MENYCFDQLKNIEVPQIIIEKAKNIPSSSPPKKHCFSRISILSGSAAAVLMALVGITLFAGLFTPHTVIAPETEHTTPVIADSGDNAVYQTKNTTDSSATNADLSQYSEPFSESREIIVTEPRETDTAKSTNVSSFQTKPTEQPQTASTSVTVSSQAKTQPQTASTSVPVTFQTQTHPQIEYTEPCTVQASGNTDASAGSVTATVNPDGFFMGKLGFVYLDDAYKGSFRCTITSSDGEMFGGEMTLTSSGEINTVLYDPLEHGEHLKSGNYTVCFYDSDSRLVLRVSFTAVSNSSALFLFPVGN